MIDPLLGRNALNEEGVGLGMGARGMNRFEVIDRGGCWKAGPASILINCAADPGVCWEVEGVGDDSPAGESSE